MKKKLEESLPLSPPQKERERLSLSTHSGTSFSPRFLMLSFFALTKSNSFPYSSLWGETHSYQTGRANEKRTTRCSDTMGQDRPWGLELLTTLSNPAAQRPSEDSRKESDTSLERGTCTTLKSSEKEKVGRGAPSRGEDARGGDVIF